ncbi:Uncharacterized protein Adt_31683 [Abeliophyllum distichum]|uniref:Uncharacterized protein n=1 Tax=Abeliophyllum distichum TaxID=126358 RepID=A0ABD1REU2_9LAMI
MSLHLGNLSSRISRDDLERVFRRFGRCTIQVKDRYGFVVYDYPAIAEKALKTLRGKRICGEPITISWSNRQPRALQRSTRGGKSYEPQRRRYSRNENDDQILGSNGQRDYETDFRRTDGEDNKFGSSDLVDEGTSYHPNVKPHAGEKDHTALDDFHEAGGIEKNHMDDDRWGEQVLVPSNEIGIENGLVFDRYEPYHSDDKKEQDEDQNHLSGSPTIRKSEERVGTRQNDSKETLDHPNNKKSQKGCYICGEVGHKMSMCPRKLKKFDFGSRGRLHPANYDVLLRQQKSDREPSTSRNQRRLLRQRDSPMAKGTTRGRRNNNEEKKRNRRDHDNFERRLSKKARGASLSSVLYDYTSSRSQSPSRSLRSLSGNPSHSKSKSVSSRKISPSSCSRSSTSCHSGSKIVKLGLRSRSNSPISAPVALGKPLSSSHNTSEVNAAGPVFNADLLETEKLQTSGGYNSTSENISAAMENEYAAGPSKVEEEKTGKYLFPRDGTFNQSISTGSYKVLESHMPKSGNGDHVADNLLVHSRKEMGEPSNENLMAEHGLAREFDVSTRSNVAKSMRMSTEEMYMVLKHYGLEHREENEKNLSLEAYFGSARLWPWEIIYYRRLKKGPIAAENYARRIAQNEEFGIVDKYIRGSGQDYLAHCGCGNPSHFFFAMFFLPHHPLQKT